MITTSFPFDYIKNCLGAISLPVTGWCADKIYVNNTSSIAVLKKIADCGGKGIAYLKAIDTYPRIDELRIRAVGPVLDYNTNGWIQFDPDTWMMALPWPNLYPISDNHIDHTSYSYEGTQNTSGQQGDVVSAGILFAYLHGLNLKFTVKVNATVSIDPLLEDIDHQVLHISNSEIQYVGGVWFISSQQNLSGTLNGDGTVYTCPDQLFTFYCRGDASMNTQENLLYQHIGVCIQVSPAYVTGYNSTHLIFNMELISVDDICGGTNFYPSKGTTFKSNPIYASNDSPYLSYVIEFNDRWV